MAPAHVQAEVQADVEAPALPAEPPPDGAVELSTDGVTWGEDTTTPFLDETTPWVPGDVRTGTLYVRTVCKVASGNAVVTVGPDDAGLTAGTGVRTRVDGGAWADGPASELMFVRTGRVTQLDVELTYRGAAGNELQGQTLPVSATVTLTCDTPLPDVVDPTPSPSAVANPAQPSPPSAGAGPAAHAGAPARLMAHPGLMPRTGIEIARTLGATALLVVAGAWLVLAARRKGAADG